MIIVPSGYLIMLSPFRRKQQIPQVSPGFMFLRPPTPLQYFITLACTPPYNYVHLDKDPPIICDLTYPRHSHCSNARAR